MNSFVVAYRIANAIHGTIQNPPTNPCLFAHTMEMIASILRWITVPTESKTAIAFKVVAKSNTSSLLHLVINSQRTKWNKCVKISNLTGYMFLESKRQSQNISI